MSTVRKDILFELVSSLSKSEKRKFRIYAKQINQNGNVLFVQLFDYLEKRSSYDPAQLVKDLPQINAKQIPNIKRLLYKHILTSLAALYKDQQISLEIRNFIDYSDILYSKGLYHQAIKILSRAKKIAISNHRNHLHLEIINAEKVIESRHITRSSTERMHGLMIEAQKINSITQNISSLSNSKLYLQRYFINYGMVKSLSSEEKIKSYYQENLAHWDLTKMTFYEKVNYHQTMYWYFYLFQDYTNCYNNSWSLVQEYLKYPKIEESDDEMFLISIHQLLNCTYFISDKERIIELLQFFEPHLKKKRLNLNTNVLSKLLYYQASCNKFFLTEEFKKGLILIPKIIRFIDSYKEYLDNYKIMILYYKMAYMNFCAGNHLESIDFLNIIINNKNPLREDIVIYSRLMLMMVHYELQNFDFLNYLIRSVERLVKQSSQSDQVSQSMILFFKKLEKTEAGNHKILFKDFRVEIEKLEQVQTNKRSFIFLNIQRWIESKI